MNDGSADSPNNLPDNNNPHSPTKKWVRFNESSTTESDSIEDPHSSELKHSSQNDHPKVAPRVLKNPTKKPASKTSTDEHDKKSNMAADIAHIDVQMEEFQPKNVIRDRNENIIAHNSPSSTRPAPPSNGKIITTIYPDNTNCPWIVPAHFNPYKMPKSLISDALTMPVETYVDTMEKLTNDFRFRIYTMFYRRVVVFWFMFGLFMLVVLLLSGAVSLLLFSLTLLWLFLTGLGVIGCMHIKKIINKHLHHCVASVNKSLLEHNLLIGVEDRGKMSCHKVALIFLYFDWKPCMPKILQSLQVFRESLSQSCNRQLDSISRQIPQAHADSVDYNGRNLTQEEQTKFLVAKCSQKYVKLMARHDLRFPAHPIQGASDQTPLHCAHSLCLCQFLQKFYFERPRRTLLQQLCLTDGVDWSASAYVDPGYHPGVMP